METLEQEFTSRVFTHMTAIVGGYIITDYLKGHIDSSSKDYDDLYEEAEQESQKILNHACAMGKLKDLYNDTWEKIKDTLPDDTNLYNPVNQQEDL